MASRARRRGRLAIAALAIVLAVILVLLRGGDDRPRGAAATRESAAAPARHGAVPGPLRTTPLAEPGAAIVIDEIALERTEICAGEHVLVTVRAHTTDPAAAGDLQVAIGGTLGDQVLLGSEATPEQPHLVTAWTPSGRVTAPVPPFEVRPCPPVPRLLVLHRAIPNTTDELELWARIDVPPGAAGFEPVRYEWRMPDGSIEVTTSPIVELDLRERPQDTLNSQVVVACTAFAADGARLTGRDAIALRNSAYENRKKGFVVLQVDRPRFPEPDERGVITQPMRIWHHDGAPVTITEVLIKEVRQDGVETDRIVAPEQVLGTAEIPPDGIGVTARLDTRAAPDLAYVYYRMTGVAENGMAVAGSFSVMAPTPLPTRDAHIPVTDTTMMAKIVRAQEILGRDHVTDEDLFRLEREGRLDGATLDADQLPESIPDGPVGPKGESGGGALTRR